MPPKKKRKSNVLDMRGGHHITARALSDVAKYIRENGLPDATSRTTIYRERKSAIMDRITPFGPLVQMRPVVIKGGGTMDIPFQHPLAMLHVCLEECGEFAKVFWAKVNVLNNRPVRLAEYADEVVPGRELIAMNDKKAWALYWSVLDLGPIVLSNEDSWWTGTYSYIYLSCGYRLVSFSLPFTFRCSNC